MNQESSSLSIINRNPAHLDGPRLLHQLLDGTRGSQQCAIDFLDNGTRTGKTSYQSLHALSDTLAKKLCRSLSRLKQKGAVILVLLEQSPELYITLLAILKAGAAFCPLSLDSPEERLRFIVEDVSARIVVTSPDLESHMPRSPQLEVLIVDHEIHQDHREEALCNHVINPTDLAYLLYTSGSTGTPKAVAVSHLAVTQSLLAHDRHIPQFSRFLQFAAPTFDVSVFEIFFPLFRKSTLVGCNRSKMLNDLPGVIRAMNVDAAELTPTVVSSLLRGRESVPGLNLLLTIGEMLTRPIVDEYGGNDAQKSILWGMYGPTEASIHCTLQSSFQSSFSVGTIGVPLDTVSVIIAAPNDLSSTSSSDIHVLPIGHTGELVVGGPQIATGYLNRPDTTAAAFIDHAQYGRLYRTGDKAKVLPDGSIECLGRLVSGQVKLRGQRLELGEIEEVIAGLEECRTVAAQIINDSIVAFCLVDSSTISSEDVLQTCRNWLPSFMVPGDVILLSVFPQLPSGKVDKRQLEANYLSRLQTPSKSDDLEVSRIKNTILSITQDVLGSKISSSTPLTTIGLDSLRSIQIASQLRKVGYCVDATDVLSASNVKTLETIAAEKPLAETFSQPKQHDIFQDIRDLVLSSSDLRQQQALVVDVIPCTPLQEAMLAETARHSDAYCNWIEVEMSNSHTFLEIKTFLLILAAKNEILRSGFCSVPNFAVPYAQIIWKSLNDAQIIQSNNFSRSYTLDSPRSLLRPIKVQVNVYADKPRLLFQIPHFLYDGWSFDLILKDLSDITLGKRSSNRPQFREVAQYYSTIRDSQVNHSRTYWKDLLADYRPTPFPNFNSKNITEFSEGSKDTPLRSIARRSGVDQTSLKERALELHINAQVFFQAGLAYVLSSYIASTDVVFGTVMSGRTLPITGIEDIIGPCIATLPLRVSISECTNARDLLDRIHLANRATINHCTTPLREIKRWCEIDPGVSLFDVLFVWQESLESHNLENLAVKYLDNADRLEFNLTLEITPSSNGILYRVNYNPCVIPESQVLILCSQLDDLVSHLIQHQDTNPLQFGICLSNVNLSIANPRPTRQRIDHGPCYSVEEWARRSPNSPALSFGSRKSGRLMKTENISYMDLNSRANKLARLLQVSGFGNDELICIYMEKSVDLYVSILAVSKLCIGYLPITPDTPVERTTWILREAGVKACISHSSCSRHIERGSGLTIMDIDTLGILEYSDQNLAIPYKGGNLAYAIFTSGSTGKPKGVLVTQDNLASNLKVLSQLYPVHDGSRLLQACSQAFDVSVFEIFFSWYTGMCLCFATKDDLFYDLESAIRQFNITHLSLTPTVAALVIPENVPNVQFLVTAGEALTEQVRRKWAGKGLYQGYGPSETTNICTINPNVDSLDVINNIGPPFCNTSAFVLDASGNTLVPRGGVGELCFGGDQVCRGYLNMPEVTATKFFEHPEYGRLYRSGDLGRLVHDDVILFVGRSDDQVKLRGHRVELREISSNILDNNSVQDSVSLIHEAEDGIQILLAFWVPSGMASRDFSVLHFEENMASTISAIFEKLQSKLPSYMVPSQLIPVTSIPMTMQSKVDKRRLIAAFQDLEPEYLDSVGQRSHEEAHGGAWSAIERQLVVALASVAKLDSSRIGRNTSFFGLGLDSISAISLSRQIAESGLGNVSVSGILQNSTISRLASSINAEKLDGSGIQTKCPQHLKSLFSNAFVSTTYTQFHEHGERVEKILPCTPLQQAMLSTRDFANPSGYFNKMVFQINGEESALRNCWQAMFQRHEILRTCFVPTEEPEYAYAQVILSQNGLPWDELNSQSNNLQQHIGKYIDDILPCLLSPFKPPVRLAFIKFESTKHLLFYCHHAMYDGAAISHLLAEIEQLFHGAELPAPLSYENYLEEMISVDPDEAELFWSEKLQHYEPLKIPNLTSKPIASKQNPSQGGKISRHLATKLNDVQGECQRMSLSLLSMLQAVWTKLLHCYTGETDICFGNVVSGRTLSIPHLERLVAPCFNAIPVRADLTSVGSNTELAQILQDFNVMSLPFQLTALRRIQSKSLPNGGRLFDSLFILQPPRQELDQGLWTLKEDSSEMDIPLVCEITPTPIQDTIELTLHYHQNVIGQTEAETIAETFDHVLRTFVFSPSAPATQMSGIPPRLLSVSNEDYSTLKLSDGGFLFSAFQRNAVLQSDQTALDFLYENGDRTVWSFKKLDEASNRIAHALLAKGIQVEDVVPVHLPKCPEFYAGILGIMKAGAAFAPFDPKLPDERKRYMLSELGSTVVLGTHDMVSNWCGGAHVVDVMATERFSRSTPVVSGLTTCNLAYCLYTSGSTGRPKAVAVEHRNPVQTIESSRSRIPWNPHSKLLQYAATTFDMCYYDCFLAWSFGFCLCAASQSAMLNDLPKIINTMDISLLDLTPTVAATISRHEVPSVKFLYCIGEAMLPTIIDRWEGECVNSYGPTEAAFCCTIFPTSRAIKPSVIGKPLPTTSFTAMSKDGKTIVPILGVGELYIGGTQVARGYHANEELTKSRFIEANEKRLYKTGDIVRILTDGNIEFLGRSDDQVKIRGLRVELSEINHVIQKSHQDIKTITTQILRKENNAKDQIVSFIVLRSLTKVSDTVIRQAAHSAATKQLPSYMVPNFFMLLPEIPLSSAGKIDKRMLTDIFQAHTDTDTEANGNTKENESNWTAMQREIRAIFSILSRVPEDTIRLRTTIYQLGMDSISAVQVAARLRKKRVQVSASDVLENPSCLDLASKLEVLTESSQVEHRANGFGNLEQTLRPTICKSYSLPSEAIESIRPCTPLQQGIIAKFIESGGAMYFNYLQLQLDKDLDISRLRSAWSATMQKNPMLRTGFAHINYQGHSFAMVNYSGNETAVPWDTDQSCSSGTEDTDEWIYQSSLRALKDLHKPPWRLRVGYSKECVTIDLAILHALYDAHSLNLILGDLAAIYRGVPTAPPSSVDTVLDSILRNRGTESSKYWQERLKEANPCRFPNLSPLRMKSSSPQVLSKASSRNMVDLENDCRAKNITMQAAGQAAWALMLAAYTGDPNVTFGTVLSGRTIEDSESLPFPTITTVPVAYRADQGNEALLRKVMEVSSSVQKHQFVPLTEIQRLAGFPDQPLFDTIFAYQKLPSHDDSPRPWTVSRERASDDYAVSLEMEPTTSTLEMRLTFSPHIIPAEQASLLLDQLEVLLIDLVTQPRTFSSIAAPYDAAIYSITPAKEPYISSDIQLLHEFVESSAKMYPQKIAFEFVRAFRSGGTIRQSWTYAELDIEGDRIANLLQSHGVKPGGMIATCFNKCPEASFAILGVLKAGCAFVALDPGAPTARKEFILKDSGVKSLLTMSAISADLGNRVNVLILNLDDEKNKIAQTTKVQLQRPITGQDTSYCLYTSGTTGTPKGCEITHENSVQAMLAFQRLFAGHWDSESRWLQFASFHFDVSVLEQYWSWSVGICVVSAPRDLIFEDIANTIRSLNITHIDLTPSLASILHPEDVPSLCRGVFITGGEQLKQEILDVWGPKGVIYNGYGPTEATIGVTMYPRVPENGKPSNIGPQFDNVGSYVLKPNSDTPVLRGAIGELCVSGKLVGKGYLNRVNLTKGRFPFLERFGERVYRTGDIVRILHDNSFSFCGRADDQVKLRGQRLEIGEINFVIKQASKTILDVATLVLKHPKQQKEQLVAFVTTKTLHRPREGPAILIDNRMELVPAKDACLDKLPGYMVPTHFVPITSMPLSTTNKADAKKLRELYSALATEDLQRLSGLSQDQDKTWSIAEQRIRDIMKTYTNTDPKDILKSSSIFELGLDSISVIGFSNKLKEAGFSNARPSLIMKNASISRLAKALTVRNGASSREHGAVIEARQKIAAIQHRQRGTVVDALNISPSDIESISPCTPLQEGMIARSLESDQPLYFARFQFQLSDSVDEAKLRAAWEKVFASTQILRTCFVNTDDGFLQVALRQEYLPWKEKSVHRAKDIDRYLAVRKEKWWKQNRIVLQRPFELVLARSTGRVVLALHIFHALYDGTSLPMLLAALFEEYSDSRSVLYGPPFQSVLPYGPLKQSNGAQNFWSKMLSASEYMPFHSLASKPQSEDVILSRKLQALDEYESARRKLHVTHQAIAQACWTMVLQAHVKSGATLGMVVSGRSIAYEGADKIIGPLFNTIPFQIQVRKSDTWAALVKRCHDFNTATLPFQHTPLRDIMKWNKRNSKNPLFESLFVYQRADKQNEKWTQNDLWQIIDDGSTADYPLAFEVEQSQDGSLKLTIVAQGHVFDHASASKLLDGFEATLASLLNDAESLIVDTFKDVFESFGTVVNPSATTNGFPKAPSSQKTDYEWKLEASTIRAEIAKLADIEAIEINENTSIFELGLDSIDAIKLSSRLKKRHIGIPVSSIMRNLTISRIVDQIASKPSDEAGSSFNGIQPQLRALEETIQKRKFHQKDVENILPVTPLQEGMVAEMMSSDFMRYFNHDTLKVGRNVDLQRLKNAWNTVYQQSPILRTSFMEIDDPGLDFSFAQITLHSPSLPWKELEIEGEDKIPQLINDIRTTAARSKLLENLFQIHLVKCAGVSYLILSLAHALYDGWSLSLLHEDIREAYFGQYKSRPQYHKFLEQTLNASGSEAYTFWQNYLSGAESVTFPRKRLSETHSDQQHRAERVSTISLPQLLGFSKQYGITLQTIGQTVWSLVLASYLHTLEVVFGSILSGRENELTTDILFPTMNTVAIRVFLHGSRLELLKDVQDNFASIRQYQHFPLRKAQRFTASLGKAILDTLFIYQKSPESSEDILEPLYESVGGSSDVEYPVCTEMEIVDDNLVWRCATHDAALDKEGASELLERFDLVLSKILEQPYEAVIGISNDGTSICGLPSFVDHEISRHTPDHTHNHSSLTTSEWTPTELTIRDVLSAVSKTPKAEVSKTLTMFHLGLDSISAIKVSSLLRKQFVQLSVSDMLRAATIEDMAQIADQTKPAAPTSDSDTDALISMVLEQKDISPTLFRAGLSLDSFEKFLPASAGQIYMLCNWMNTRGALFYPEFQYQTSGPVDVEVLYKAWNELVACNPLLRTCFFATRYPEVPYLQGVRRNCTNSFHDISDIKEASTAQYIKENSTHQPYAFLFARRSPNHWLLTLKIHHALYDGVSLPILVRQLQDICNNPIAHIPQTFAFTRLLASASTTEARKKRQAFWASYLEGAPSARFTQPSSAISPRTELFRPSLIENVGGLEQLSRQSGLSIQSLFLAAYGKMYSALISQNQEKSDGDVVIGIYLANRSHGIEGLSEVATPAVNLVPLRIKAPQLISLHDSAAQIQRDLQEIGSLENSAVGLWEIASWTGVKIDSFVNFLKLPEADVDDDNSGIDIQEAKGEEEGWSRTVPPMENKFVAVKELEDDLVRDSYLHTVDVEATIKNGSLDVGVFCSAKMLNLKGAERFIAELKSELINFVAQGV